MEYRLPEAFDAQKTNAAKQAKKEAGRLSVHANDKVFPIRRFSKTGFALDADQAPPLRGLVDIFDGSSEISQCLVIHSKISNGLRYFEFKRCSLYRNRPPLDYADETKIFGYLTE